MTSGDNPRLTAALAYAAKGWYVLPCQPRLKVPATEHGWQDASTDENTIKSWWKENPNYNVAIATGPSNLFVVDVDPGGLAGWDALIAADPVLAGLEEAMPRVDTPRGGFHFYMAGEGPTSASKLAQGVDTRGKGGYVLAPPSYVDDGKSKGEYLGEPHLDDLPPVHKPLVDMLARVVPERTAPKLPPDQIQWDLPETLVRAEAWLQSLVRAGDVAIEGAGGDQRTYEVSCKLLEMGITPDRAADLLSRLWNPHCSPPWGEAELALKIHNAWRYGQETKGGKAEPPLEQTFAHLIERQQEEPPTAEEIDLRLRYQPKFLGDARRNRKPLEWIVDGLLPRKGVGILYGPPATFKTFLLLDLALSVASGHGPNWWQDGDRQPQQVLYLAGESPDALVTKRVDAWLSCRLLPGLEEKVATNFIVVEGVPPFEMADYWRYIIEWQRENNVKPALVVIDTIARAMAGWDENSARDATRTTLRMEWLARELDSFVIGVHHSGKDKERGARGSSAWLGNTDFMLETDRLTDKGLEVLAHVRKLKEGDPSDMPLMFRGHPYNGTLAFAREWDFKPEPAKVETKKSDDVEWATPETLAGILAQGPLTTDHLCETLANQWGIKKATVRMKLTNLRYGRYKAWCPEGDVWMIPEGFMQPKKEEF